MQIQVTWFDGVTQRIDVEDEPPLIHLQVRREDQKARLLLVRVGRLPDGTPRYVEDTSGYAGSPPLWSYLQ